MVAELWDALPLNIKSTTSKLLFKRKLKTSVEKYYTYQPLTFHLMLPATKEGVIGLV